MRFFPTSGTDHQQQPTRNVGNLSPKRLSPRPPTAMTRPSQASNKTKHLISNPYKLDKVPSCYEYDSGDSRDEFDDDERSRYDARGEEGHYDPYEQMGGHRSLVDDDDSVEAQWRSYDEDEDENRQEQTMRKDGYYVPDAAVDDPLLFDRDEPDWDDTVRLFNKPRTRRNSDSDESSMEHSGESDSTIDEPHDVYDAVTESAKDNSGGLFSNTATAATAAVAAAVGGTAALATGVALFGSSQAETKEALPDTTLTTTAPTTTDIEVSAEEVLSDTTLSTKIPTSTDIEATAEEVEVSAEEALSDTTLTTKVPTTTDIEATAEGALVDTTLKTTPTMDLGVAEDEPVQQSSNTGTIAAVVGGTAAVAAGATVLGAAQSVNQGKVTTTSIVESEGKVQKQVVTEGFDNESRNDQSSKSVQEEQVATTSKRKKPKIFSMFRRNKSEQQVTKQSQSPFRRRKSNSAHVSERVASGSDSYAAPPSSTFQEKASSTAAVAAGGTALAGAAIAGSAMMRRNSKSKKVTNTPSSMTSSPVTTQISALTAKESAQVNSQATSQLTQLVSQTEAKPSQVSGTDESARERESTERVLTEQSKTCSNASKAPESGDTGSKLSASDENISNQNDGTQTGTTTAVAAGAAILGGAALAGTAITEKSQKENKVTTVTESDAVLTSDSQSKGFSSWFNFSDDKKSDTKDPAIEDSTKITPAVAAGATILGGTALAGATIAEKSQIENKVTTVNESDAALTSDSQSKGFSSWFNFSDDKKSDTKEPAIEDSTKIAPAVAAGATILGGTALAGAAITGKSQKENKGTTVIESDDVLTSDSQSKGFSSWFNFSDDKKSDAKDPAIEDSTNIAPAVATGATILGGMALAGAKVTGKSQKENKVTTVTESDDVLTSDSKSKDFSSWFNFSGDNKSDTNEHAIKNTKEHTPAVATGATVLGGATILGGAALAGAAITGKSQRDGKLTTIAESQDAHVSNSKSTTFSSLFHKKTGDKEQSIAKKGETISSKSSRKKVTNTTTSETKPISDDSVSSVLGDFGPSKKVIKEESSTGLFDDSGAPVTEAQISKTSISKGPTKSSRTSFISKKRSSKKKPFGAGTAVVAGTGAAVAGAAVIATKENSDKSKDGDDDPKKSSGDKKTGRSFFRKSNSSKSASPVMGVTGSKSSNAANAKAETTETCNLAPLAVGGAAVAGVGALAATAISTNTNGDESVSTRQSSKVKSNRKDRKSFFSRKSKTNITSHEKSSNPVEPPTSDVPSNVSTFATGTAVVAGAAAIASTSANETAAKEKVAAKSAVKPMASSSQEQPSTAIANQNISASNLQSSSETGHPITNGNAIAGAAATSSTIAGNDELTGEPEEDPTAGFWGLFGSKKQIMKADGEAKVTSSSEKTSNVPNGAALVTGAAVLGGGAIVASTTAATSNKNGDGEKIVEDSKAVAPQGFWELFSPTKTNDEGEGSTGTEDKADDTAVGTIITDPLLYERDGVKSTKKEVVVEVDPEISKAAKTGSLDNQAFEALDQEEPALIACLRDNYCPMLANSLMHTVTNIDRLGCHNAFQFLDEPCEDLDENGTYETGSLMQERAYAKDKKWRKSFDNEIPIRTISFHKSDADGEASISSTLSGRRNTGLRVNTKLEDSMRDVLETEHQSSKKTLLGRVKRIRKKQSKPM